MAPITVDPQALSGAGASAAAVGDGVAAAMATLTGGADANTGHDAAGIVFGRQYVAAGASLLKAITAGVNACRNTGYGVQTSAVNYSRAEAASDISGHAEPLGSPPCPVPVSVPGSPSSSGAPVLPPALWVVVAQFVGSPWPDGNPAEMRAAAAAWRAAAVPLYHVTGDLAVAYNTIAAQQIGEGSLMTAAVRDIGTNLAGVASSCQELASTLEQYAGQVEKTQQAIRQLCDRVGSIGGIVGAFFEFVQGHGEEELHKIADEIKTVLGYLGSEADASLALLESAKQSVDGWVLDLEKSADRTFVEFFGDRVGGALSAHFSAVADSGEGVFRWGTGMVEGVVALDPTRFASSPDAAGQTWEGLAKFAALVGDPVGSVARDPRGSLDMLKGLVHADDWSKDRPMLGATQNVLDIASAVIPGLGEAGAAGDAASAVGRVARVGEETGGVAGAIGRVGEIGRSTAALSNVAKETGSLTERLGAIADKPPSPPVGGRPVSLSEPGDTGRRLPLTRQPAPELGPATRDPGGPARSEIGTVQASEQVPAFASEAQEPVRNLSASGEGLPGFGTDLVGPSHAPGSIDSGLGVHGDQPLVRHPAEPGDGSMGDAARPLGAEVGSSGKNPEAAANAADPGTHGPVVAPAAEHGLSGHRQGDHDDFQEVTHDHDVPSSDPSVLSPDRRDEILAMDKGERPDPSEYLSPQFIHHHLEQFRDGAARFMPQSNLERYGIGQVDGTTFVMPKHEADAVQELSTGDPGALERALGLPEGFLKYNKVVRIDIHQPEDFGLRMPSGNEAGANDMWVPGGLLPDGSSEAIVDGGAIPNDRYDVSDVSEPEPEG